MLSQRNVSSANVQVAKPERYPPPLVSDKSAIEEWVLIAMLPAGNFLSCKGDIRPLVMRKQDCSF